ncbi:uncharacterized protein LOC143442857 [Arvicanthis niloticus]|uniref:uncharacterized protein LOC143313083 n=1 Tax=Arvicanthis niloticus TaxID=61156 RepID=UPI00402BAA86
MAGPGQSSLPASSPRTQGAALCTPVHKRRRPQEAGGPSPPCRRLLGERPLCCPWCSPTTCQRPTTAAWKRRVGGRPKAWIRLSPDRPCYGRIKVQQCLRRPW